MKDTNERNVRKRKQGGHTDGADGEALLRADRFTNVPKVSHSSLTKEERAELVKQAEAESREAEKLASAHERGPVGRWWVRLQSGPNKISLGMAIVALGVGFFCGLRIELISAHHRCTPCRPS